mgnify:CR=1 FL=1
MPRVVARECETPPTEPRVRVARIACRDHAWTGFAARRSARAHAFRAMLLARWAHAAQYQQVPWRVALPSVRNPTLPLVGRMALAMALGLAAAILTAPVAPPACAVQLRLRWLG